MIRNYLGRLFEQGREKSSQARALSGIKSFFNYLLLEEVIESSPAELIEAPKTSRSLPDTLSTEVKQQSDVKKAEADAAYSIQEQAQRKTIEVASANADIARAERTAELKSKEVEVTKQTLDAQIRAKADAERYAAQQAAEAELFRRYTI